MSTWFTMGVDLGSTTAKAVIVDDAGTMIASKVVQMGAVSTAAVAIAIDAVLSDAGLTQSHIARTISTGYGRRLVPGADKTFTEITCHARGAAALSPGVKLVIDIGGQDSKTIAVDADGLVDRFALNDRCASGTGRFFDVLCRALEVDLEQVGELALGGDEHLEVSSMCATFAETEVISLLAQGSDKADIAASVHRAVAARTLGLVAQVGKASPVVITGGVAKNPALVHYLSEALRLPIEQLDDPQIAGALGAALIARDEHAAALRDLGGSSSASPVRGSSAAPRGSSSASRSDTRIETTPAAIEIPDVTPDQQVGTENASTPHSCAECNGDLAAHGRRPVPVILQMNHLVGEGSGPAGR